MLKKIPLVKKPKGVVVCGNWFWLNHRHVTITNNQTSNRKKYPGDSKNIDVLDGENVIFPMGYGNETSGDYKRELSLERSFGFTGSGGFGFADCGGGWTLPGTVIGAGEVTDEWGVESSPSRDTSVLKIFIRVYHVGRLTNRLSPPSVTREPVDDSCDDDWLAFGPTRESPPIDMTLSLLRSGAIGVSASTFSKLVVIGFEGGVSFGRAPTAML